VINCFDIFDAAIPFGGYKMSGIGREKGMYSPRNYLPGKSCCVLNEESCMALNILQYVWKRPLSKHML